jgi:hypothetical protein
MQRKLTGTVNDPTTKMHLTKATVARSLFPFFLVSNPLTFYFHTHEAGTGHRAGSSSPYHWSVLR